MPDDDRDLDYALIRLDEPILGVEPIPVAADVKNLPNGTKMLMVSAMQERMKPGRKVLPNEPVIQQFTVQGIIPSQNNRGMVVSSDASGTLGSSGSLVFTRDDSGRLVGAGIHARSANKKLDGKGYDPTPDTGNHSYQLMFDGPLASHLKASLELRD